MRQYEVFWERAGELPELIQQAWDATQTTGNLAAVTAGLNQVMDKLQGWSRRKFGNVLRDLECTRKKLDHLVQTNGDPLV